MPNTVTVQQLIAHLSTLPQDAPVSLRDLNGLDWYLELHNILLEDEHVVISTKDINVV